MPIEERIASALELIAARLDTGQSNLLQTQIDTLESLLRDVVGLIENPASTNEAWTALHAEIRETLGMV